MTQLEKRITRLLRSVTRAPGVIVSTGEDAKITAEIELKAQTVVLQIAWAGEGWPDDVRKALANANHARDPNFVVLARFMAPGARELLLERGTNWADESGAASIYSDTLIVQRDGTGQREIAGHATAQDFEWSRSAMDVAEVALSMGDDRPLKLMEMSEQTQWSAPQVSVVLRAFEAKGWVQNTGASRGRGARRILADKIGLLNSWSEQLAKRPPQTLYAHVVTEDLMGFLRRELLPKLNQSTRWAVTGWAGGELIAPFTSLVPVLQIYVDENFFGTDLVRSLGLTPVDEGGSIELRSASGLALSLATADTDHVYVASPARVFADLKALGGRGEDAADHLLSEVIVAGDLAHRPSSSVSTRVEVVPQSPTELEIGELQDWERESRNRFSMKLNELQPDQRPLRYTNGSWTASYILRQPAKTLGEPDFLDALRNINPRLLGWPPWLVSDVPDSKPYMLDGAIECWLMGGREHESDFWRAEASGKLFLLRAFEEDNPRDFREPGRMMSLTLPVWRVGEVLLHASMLAETVGAESVDLLFRWEGLRGRELSNWPQRSRTMPADRQSVQNVVTTSARATPQRIERDLPVMVRQLVEPLFTVFDFFRPPESLYFEELEELKTRL